MPGCNKDNHDHAHCYGKGGGMEGQAPWMKNKLKTNVSAAAITAPAAVTPPSTATPAIAVMSITGLKSLMENMLFVSISELPEDVSCITGLPFTTILDSGTTLMLIKDRYFFHTYSTENAVPVTTVNHGILEMTGCRNCVVWWTISN
jgi:hypothetical protein